MSPSYQFVPTTLPTILASWSQFSLKMNAHLSTLGFQQTGIVSRESAKQVHIECNAHEIWFTQSLLSLYLGYLSTISIYNMLRSPGCVASVLEG